MEILIGMIPLILLIIVVGGIVFAASRGLEVIRQFLGLVKTIDSVEGPSSPRQLQNLTNTYESIIRRDFPEFDVNEFLSMVEGVLKNILNSLEARHLINTDYMADVLIQDIDSTIEDIKSKNETWFFDDIYIQKSAISKYSKQSGSKVIRSEVALSYKYRVLKDGKIISEDSSSGQYKYWIETVYIQDASKFEEGSMIGHNCPNCGAPVVDVGENKFCKYCGSGLTEVNMRIWSFTRYKRC